MADRKRRMLALLDIMVNVIQTQLNPTGCKNGENIAKTTMNGICFLFIKQSINGIIVLPKRNN